MAYIIMIICIIAEAYCYLTKDLIGVVFFGFTDLAILFTEFAKDLFDILKDNGQELTGDRATGKDVP
jgi:hypothetical protein